MSFLHALDTYLVTKVWNKFEAAQVYIASAHNIITLSVFGALLRCQRVSGSQVALQRDF